MRCGFLLAVVVALSWTAEARMWNGFRAPRKSAAEIKPGYIWLEAEEFADYGTWQIDTQFVGKMGSAYLIANGVTNTCRDAVTTVKLPRGEKWSCWVRTRDWIPEFHPGLFAVAFDGVRSGALGNRGVKGWAWQKAGDFDLKAGQVEVRLQDLSGWFGRCDALILTTDADFVPPDDSEATERLREELAGLGKPVDGGEYDVVIVGGGPAGTTAAIQSARLGAKTLLVTDRPVLGGNASSEFRIPPSGVNTVNKDYPVGGIDKEMLDYAKFTKDKDWTDAYERLVAKESKLTTVMNTRITAAATEAGRVRTVSGVNTLDGQRIRFSGKVFVDATGDGWLGFFAGAKYRFGSEASGEFDEPYAPKVASGKTMSGSLWSGLGRATGCQIGYWGVKSSSPQPFKGPEWANLVPADWERTKIRRFDWESLEHPHVIDDVDDPEYARDYLIRMHVSYWDWAKNRAENRDECANWIMAALPITDARREGRRLVGDYMLTEKDELEGRRFADAVGYGGYPITTHDSGGDFTPAGDYYRPEPPPYQIPFRALYSVNVTNLLMCGRCVSVSHRGLGSLRVQSTCAITGQAVGYAAARCAARGISPRQFGADCIGELQEELRRVGVLYGMRIRLQSPVKGEPVALLPPEQKHIMSLATREERNAYLKTCDRGVWRRAEPVVLKWRSQTDYGCIGVWRIELSRTPDFSDFRTFYAISAATNEQASLTIPFANLELDADYFWRVKWRGMCADSYVCDLHHGCVESKYESVSETVGSFHTEAMAPRWIELEGRVKNVRDLGGRRVPGGRVRQNLVFRGEGLNDNAEGGYEAGRNRLMVEDRDYLVKTLGVKTDLDLRCIREVAGLKSSPLGPEVNYIWRSSFEYGGIFTEEGKRTMAENFRVFTRRENYPVYFHCILGADRTGALAYMLNGVLGVSKRELELDWEATFYIKPKGVPDRMTALDAALSKYGDATSSWQERIVLYLKDCGITDAEIAAVRGILVETESH